MSYLEPIAAELGKALAELDDNRVVERLWQKDHTLWRPEPMEIANRLGWLELVSGEPVADSELAAFVEAVRRDGFRDVVLLGMGGSSLGAEALRRSYGPQEGSPRLHVLDSVHPRWVERVRRSVDPASTLFLVASKSGTTAEVMAFYRYFRGAVAGATFAAVTDPGSPLADLAERDGFRHVFLNRPDIGGRFSVLSRFGMVAAALAGMDTEGILGAAHGMAQASKPDKPVGENPAAWLGAVLGAAARSGRPFLTLLVSEPIACFGLWAEQLLAESTGKDGTGVLPVAQEPAVDAAAYGDDRLFVALHFADDPALEERAAVLAAAGQPVVELAVESLAGLGGELFRWEFATAVAGHLLGVHPFNQPDVESTKVQTRRLLAAFKETGELPPVETGDDLRGALAERPTYVALMAYADESAELEEAVADLRQRLVEGFGVVTTFGYGPRFLHSTGQYHKGGAPGGLFVQLLAETTADLPIPDEAFGFGTLCQAQAAGDLAALHENGRRTVRIDLGDEAAAGVRRLLETLG